MNICGFLMIFTEKFDFGQKIKYYAKEFGSFSTSKRPKTDLLNNRQKSSKFGLPFWIKFHSLKE